MMKTKEFLQMVNPPDIGMFVHKVNQLWILFYFPDKFKLQFSIVS